MEVEPAMPDRPHRCFRTCRGQCCRPRTSVPRPGQHLAAALEKGLVLADAPPTSPPEDSTASNWLNQAESVLLGKLSIRPETTHDHMHEARPPPGCCVACFQVGLRVAATRPLPSCKHVAVCIECENTWQNHLASNREMQLNVSQAICPYCGPGVA